MRVPLVLLAAPLFMVQGSAHPMSEHGNTTAPVVPEALQGHVLALRGMAPGLIPPGLLFFEVQGVQGGDSYSVVADDGQEALVVGPADSCPGPDWSPEGLASGEDSVEEVWLLCMNVPDINVWFTCTGERDTTGIVPCDGDALIFAFFGTGEGITYSES